MATAPGSRCVWPPETARSAATAELQLAAHHDALARLRALLHREAGPRELGDRTGEVVAGGAAHAAGLRGIALDGGRAVPRGEGDRRVQQVAGRSRAAVLAVDEKAADRPHARFVGIEWR